MDGQIKATGTPLRVCEIPTDELVAELFSRHDYALFYGKVCGHRRAVGPDGYSGDVMRSVMHGGRYWSADDPLAAAALINIQAMKNLIRINRGLVEHAEEEDDGEDNQESTR